MTASCSQGPRGVVCWTLSDVAIALCSQMGNRAMSVAQRDLFGVVNWWNSTRTDRVGFPQSALNGERSSSTAMTHPVVAEHLSKNAKKRLAREERTRERKRLRKEERKADISERKAQRRAERNALLATLPEDEREAYLEERKASFRQGREKERAQRENIRDILLHGTHYSVCIDLGWTCHMNEKELKSLARQIAYSYNALRRTAESGNVPIKLSIAGLDDRMKEVFMRHANGWQDWPILISDNSLTKLHAPGDIVYLTHDAPDVLQTLDPSKVYAIGGIVDRNRLKGATFQKAQTFSLSTARLNLSSNVHMNHGTPVLTVNHCVEILQLFANGRSWQEAYAHVLPPRKGLTMNLLLVGVDSENSHDKYLQ